MDTIDPSEEIAPSDSVPHIHIALDLPEGARVRVTVESLTNTGATEGAPVRVVFESQGSSAEPIVIYPSPPIAATASLPSQPVAARLRAALKSWPYSLEMTLFGMTLIIYLATRLIGLTQFPIYFFTDEAIQTVAAADLLRNDLRNEEKTFLPTYFKNGAFYNLSASVYLQVLPYLFFGKSVFATRATSVLVGLLAAVAIGLTLRDIFKIPYWWAGAALLSIAPAWFLHSRTAFETVIFVSFYAAFLYFYLLYRCRSPRYLNFAILMGALAFYSYSPGQLVILATGFLLLLSDARFHWENRRTVLRGLGLLLLLGLPYLRFRLGHPEAPIDHLRRLGSYWVQPMPLRDKISTYVSEYFYGLSPGYWFIPNERDLARHLMKGYGNLLRATLPFAAFGLILAIKEWRSPAYRAVMIALLMAPLGSALVQIGITRTLVFIIPATLLTALGISKVLTWLEGKKIPHTALSIGLFVILTAFNLFMLADALVKGPTWYQDNGLGGMQYGARQLFPEVKKYVEKNPTTKMIVSPNWANGTDVVARFFLDDPLPIQIGSIDGHIFQRQPLDENTLFVMTPEEYQLVRESGKFTDIQVEQTLPYPNGQPGFYFVRLRYVENIDQILEVEREQRRVLQSSTISLDGRPVEVKYSLLDMGEAQHMFDGNLDTVSRTLEANPAIIELTFPETRLIEGVSLIIGSTEAEIKADLYPTLESKPISYSSLVKGTIEEPEVALDFNEAFPTRKIRLEVKDIHQGEPGHIHIWEIEFK